MRRPFANFSSPHRADIGPSLPPRSGLRWVCPKTALPIKGSLCEPSFADAPLRYAPAIETPKRAGTVQGTGVSSEWRLSLSGGLWPSATCKTCRSKSGRFGKKRGERDLLCLSYSWVAAGRKPKTRVNPRQSAVNSEACASGGSQDENRRPVLIPLPISPPFSPAFPESLIGSLCPSAACKLCFFNRPVFGGKFGLFCRKTGVPRKLFCTFFPVFPAFWVFLRCKPLPFNHKRRSGPFKKNHTKNTTVGFSFVPGFAIIGA